MCTGNQTNKKSNDEHKVEIEPEPEKEKDEVELEVKLRTVHEKTTGERNVHRKTIFGSTDIRYRNEREREM